MARKNYSEEFRTDQRTDVNFDLKYEYDTTGRIIRGRWSTNSTLHSDVSYEYDKNSNMTKWTEYVSPTYTKSFVGNYNAANQLTSVGGATSLANTYDGNGMWTGDNQGGSATYDERGRTDTMKHHDSSGAARKMEYDGNTQTDRTRAGDTTFATSMIGVTSSTDATGTTDYILAPDGRVLGQTGPNGKTYYLLKDRLGSTTTVTNEAGTVVNRYWYDPYGNYEGGQAPDPDKDIPLVHWRYTGQWLDSDKVDSGNYKIGLRYYDPAQHRWTQTDPLERVTNPGQPAESQPYTYTGCNPTNRTDPSGAIDWPGVGSTVGGAVLGGLAVAAFCAGTAGFGCAVTVGAAGGALGGVLGGGALGGEAYGDYALNGAIGGAISGLPFNALRGVP